ncbi:MAG: hypothetical protein ACC661_03625, partial [Verrucomicrobiales bacterium]
LLIGADDRLRAIYRGPVDPDTLARDVANLLLEGEPLRAASLPFPGRWTAGAPPSARPLSLAEDLLDAGLLDAAERYIDHYRSALEPDPLFPALLERLGRLQ